MNLAEFSIQKKTIVLVLTVLMVVAGALAYTKLGRLEDPEFTIKEAKVVTAYPGARPQEVEQEVTDIIETEIQQLGQLKRVTSTSKEGLSIITAEIKDQYDKESLPQVWDELRRKVHDVQSKLPPGVQSSVVNDDYGDVFGIFYAIIGDGFTDRELEDYVDMLRRELLLVPGVAKIDLWGVQEEAVYVEIPQAKLAQLGIPLSEIFTILKQQNLVVPSGNVKVDDEYISIKTTGGFDTVADIGNILLRGSQTDKLIYLRDIAKISRGYKSPPDRVMGFDGKKAIGLGISVVSGGNIVDLGAAVSQRIKELVPATPLGMEIKNIYYQPGAVTDSVNAFIINLIEAVAIVIAVLLLFMGLRSGLIIGGILVLTILGTFYFMNIMAIPLQRISLGALIIALGMLVDNAIVVVDGYLINIQQGIDKVKAVSSVVAKTMWPLFGATLVGILAFAAISLSQDSTGEYTRSLFYVIMISLLLSWLLAVTVTPLACVYLIPAPKKTSKTQQRDPYKGAFYMAYQAFLQFCIRVRWLTVAVMVGLLAVSVFCFQFVDQSFFPDSTMPQFMVDLWMPEGTDIRVTAEQAKKLQEFILTLDDVESVASFTGAGGSRFTLIYAPEEDDSAYAQMIVNIKDYRQINEYYAPKIRKFIQENIPQALGIVNKFRFGTGSGALIQVRFSGPDANVLRQLATQATDIMHASDLTTNVKTDWRQRVKAIQANYAEQRARALGISRADVSVALAAATEGTQVGTYREENKLLPIMFRMPENERSDVANLQDITIWSEAANRAVPIRQVVSSFATVWEDPILKRRNRKLTITAQCDPRSGPASIALNDIMPKIDAIELPPGYEREWGGEYEDSQDAQAGLASKIPPVIVGMVLLVILLFNALRQPLIIWLCVPLAFIGVTAGLLMTHQPFGFMALLGFLSLSGMLIKNAIVLVDQIDIEIAEGKAPYQAVVHSAVSRVRPVGMAAATTILGMTPLIFDAFYVSMAITIMFGLAFATLLTLIVVPVLYTIFFRIK